MDLIQIKETASSYFDLAGQQQHVFFAPGRVCLIGEHIDYNGGSVLPAALSLGVYAIFQPNNSNKIRMRSGIDDREVVVSLNEEIIYRKENGWGNYPIGVIRYLIDRGLEIPGGDIYFESNLPTGAGLSSSASIEVLTAFMLLALSGNKSLSNKEIALLCKNVENEFVGVKCGIMDQFAVAMGKKNQAIMLDCTAITHEYVPVNLNGHDLIIFNTNKKRELTDSQFNQRTEECREAFESIRQFKDIECLAKASLDDVNRHVSDPLIKKRALHVVMENQRVFEAVDALKLGDIERFGRLLFKTHESLKHQYEVSGHELDTIEEAARSHSSVIGAKMSGAGFGGCAFAIVEHNKVDEVVELVLEKYQAKTGLKADYYIAQIEDGVRHLEN